MVFSMSEISRVISSPRFATYLRHCHNDRGDALSLYQWNMELSSAFIVPLHVLEISIRNAVVEALEAVHTASWPWNQGFVISLPNPQRGYSPSRNLQQVAGQQRTMGKVVAELKFVFWEKMFTSRHDTRIWNTHLYNLLPHAPNTLTVQQLRASIHNDIRDIRELRNRIAHHEPIFLRNVSDDYANIYKLISWRSDVVATWMDDLQSVRSVIARKP
ncbi:MAG: hypothetical protein F6K30_19670 [Cyanothece sp. SIO2G6]|nr:hypothetical protein [Cyanothece sp. SIO2G6]